jgi:hypothetical protein
LNVTVGSVFPAVVIVVVPDVDVNVTIRDELAAEYVIPATSLNSVPLIVRVIEPFCVSVLVYGLPLPPVPLASIDATEKLALRVNCPAALSRITKSVAAGVQAQVTPPDVRDQVAVALEFPPAGTTKQFPPPTPQATACAGTEIATLPIIKKISVQSINKRRFIA